MVKISGYSEKYRETIIRSALNAWENQIEQDRNGQRPLYRPREWRKEERTKKKELKKSGWFKKLGGKTNDFSLFCAASPGGKLASLWRKELEEMRKGSGGLVRGYVAEKSGIPLSALLFNNQPGEKDTCGKVDCNPCKTGTTKKLSCRKVSRGRHGVLLLLPGLQDDVGGKGELVPWQVSSNSLHSPRRAPDRKWSWQIWKCIVQACSTAPPGRHSWISVPSREILLWCNLCSNLWRGVHQSLTIYRRVPHEQQGWIPARWSG